MIVGIVGFNGFIGSSLLRYLNRYVESCIPIKDVTSIEDFTSGNYIIINCAGSANVSESFNDVDKDFNSNVVLVRRILESIRISKNSGIKLINLSSAAVYGNPIFLPVHEKHDLNPLSPYGYHKIIAENLCKEYYSCFGVKSVNLRIFSTYGVGQKKMLMWDIYKKILSSKGEIVLFGTGNETRDYIHVEDLAQQILLTINKSQFDGASINCANGEEICVKDILELYKKHYSKCFKYHFNGETRVGDPINWKADISVMLSLGYKKSVNFEHGIEEYINWLIKL